MESIRPTSLWLNITDECNNACVWCYQKTSESKKSLLTLDKAKKILKASKECGVTDCVLIGGEPTLHPEVFEIIEESKNFGITTVIISNGLFPEGENFTKKLINSGLDAINISLHGWDEESYFRFTGSKEGFNKMKKNIADIYKSNLNVGMAFVLSECTYPYLSEAIKNFKKIGVKSIEFNVASPSVSKDSVDGDYMLPLDKQKIAVMQACELCLQYEINVGVNFNIPHCLFTEAELSFLVGNARITSGCSMRNGSGLIFNVNGGLTVCNHFSDFEVASFDDCLKYFNAGNFLDYWNSGNLSAIRQEVTCYHHEACSECEQWVQCGGGCPINWLQVSPQSDLITPIFFPLRGGEVQ